jgi:succinate dehydrogenase/fumarate reductase cytochrome b subunit
MTTTTASDSDAGSTRSADVPAEDPVESSADRAGGEAPDVDEPRASPPASRNRAGILTGLVLFAYAVFLAVEVVVAGFDHRLYNRFHEVQGNTFARAILAVVVLCAIYHGLNGLRMVAIDLPLLSRHDLALRNLVVFATFALGIPAAAVILWPSISELVR